MPRFLGRLRKEFDLPENYCSRTGHWGLKIIGTPNPFYSPKLAAEDIYNILKESLPREAYSELRKIIIEEEETIHSNQQANSVKQSQIS